MAPEKPGRQRRKGRGGWWFLAGMLGLHLVVHLVDPGYSDTSLEWFITSLTRLSPLFGVMLSLLWLFNLFVKPRRVVENLGHRSGLRGWILAVGGGVFSMGPMYLWYPLLGDLHRQGLRPALAAAFLYSRAVKLPMLPFMAHYFGGLYTALFTAGILLVSVLSGLAMERLTGRPGLAGG